MTTNEKIIQIISETLGVEKNEIKPESDFYEDLNASKLELADLLLKIQEELKISIPEDSLTKIAKVSDLINQVEINSDI